MAHTVQTPHGELVMARRRIIGLDLSLNSTGWALVDSCGSYTTGLVDGKPMAGQPIECRLLYVARMVRGAIRMADFAVVEQPFSTLNASHGAMVFGAVATTLAERGCPLVTVPPTSVKKYAHGRATSLGTSPKTASVVAARERLGYQGYSDDETDALWLAHLGWHLIGHPVIQLPKNHTDTLSAKWATGWPAGPAPKPTTKTRKRGNTQP